MTWPTVATKVNLDQASDDPKQARSELATLVDKVNQVQGQFTGISISAETRAAVETTTIATDVKTITTGGYATAGDQGGATYKRVGSEPSHALKVQSSDNAWWELVPDSQGYINVKQAGAVGDDTANDGQAFIDALSFASLAADGFNNATYGVSVPPSDTPYYLGANTLELKRTVHFVGQNTGLGAGACKLRWDANITGIIVHRHNTIGAGVEALGGAGNLAAGASKIEGLELTSDGGTIANVTDSTKGHGIWLRARAVLVDLRITGFPGNGINIVAGAGGADDIEGNANSWVVERVNVKLCHLNGIFVDAADVNAGYCKAASLVQNGRWGIYDSSFLGNTYEACHTAFNGLATAGENGATKSSYVHFGGRRYSANVAASEADLVATTPGTDEAVWYDIVGGGATSKIPTWLASQAEGTYFHGGPYRSDNVNARNVFIGMYSESDQGASQWVDPTLVLGGLINQFRGTAIVHNDATITGRVEFRPGIEQAISLTVVTHNTTENMLTFGVEGDHSRGLAIAYEGATGQIVFKHGNLAARIPLRFTTDLTTESYGRDADLGAGEVIFSKGIFLGIGLSARRVANASVAATTGDRARGEFDFNVTPAAGAPAGWYCTTAHATTPTFTALYGVGTQQSNIPDPTGGGTVDTEARAAINSLIAALEHFGFTST